MSFTEQNVCLTTASKWLLCETVFEFQGYVLILCYGNSKNDLDWNSEMQLKTTIYNGRGSFISEKCSVLNVKVEKVD